MVDFTLTDEQKNLREMAHDFAVKEMRPVAWEYDKDGTWPDQIPLVVIVVLVLIASIALVVWGVTR